MRSMRTLSSGGFRGQAMAKANPLRDGDNKKETANASSVFPLRMTTIFGDADKWLVSGHAGAELVEKF
jgi:hypothetical protein